ncbi:hypothetical protein BDR26DRAFT_861472 [Obelidium mucronatum]|nr:hypothetical protein BDR26DRAFT_861472 [Obelidium mucronatum]
MTWEAPVDGKWQFLLLGPQGKVGAGQLWYLRANNSINGIPNLNPDAATIKAVNTPAVSGNPSLAGSGGSGGAGSGIVADVYQRPTASGPPPPAWQRPLMIGGSIAGVIAVFAIGSLIYTKFKKDDPEDAPRPRTRPDRSAAQISPESNVVEKPQSSYQALDGVGPVIPMYYDDRQASRQQDLQPPPLPPFQNPQEFSYQQYNSSMIQPQTVIDRADEDGRSVTTQAISPRTTSENQNRRGAKSSKRK